VDPLSPEMSDLVILGWEVGSCWVGGGFMKLLAFLSFNLLRLLLQQLHHTRVSTHLFNNQQ
jgi:hypothetical protein